MALKSGNVQVVRIDGVDISASVKKSKLKEARNTDTFKGSGGAVVVRIPGALEYTFTLTVALEPSVVAAFRNAHRANPPGTLNVEYGERGDESGELRQTFDVQVGDIDGDVDSDAVPTKDIELPVVTDIATSVY